MGRIALTRTAFVFTILVVVIYCSYETFNVWAAIGAGALWWLIWTIYCNWLNKRQRLGVEEYISDFSIPEKSLQEYQQMTDFIFNRKQCDGQVAITDLGVHLRLNSAYRIAWDNVKGITLISGAANTTLARLFLGSDIGVKDKLFITWNDYFNDKIPSSVLFVDSRSSSE